MTSHTHSTKSLRICLVSRAPFFGGAEQAGLRLAQGLQQAGHEVLMIVGEDNEVRQAMADADLNVVVCPLPQTDHRKWWAYMSARTRLRRIIKAFRPDIVHANDLPTHQIASDAVRDLNVKRVCHQRFIYSGKAIDWLNKRGADLHLFISPAFMQDMCGKSAQLASEPGALVPDGLPMPALPTDADRLEARKHLGLPLHQFILTFTGQVIERKGVADLLHAVAVLPWQQRMAVKLVIVGDDLAGDGAYRLMMEQLAHTLDVDAHFAGFCRDVDRYLVASDTVVLPSHAEPLGLTIMEAMSHGRACIGTNVGGIPSMIVHEHTGLLVEPSDPQGLSEAIGRLVCDDVLRQTMAVAARRHCRKQFSIEVHVENVLREYHMLLGHVEQRRSA